MKRTLGFILIVAACVAGFLSLRGALPFMPIAGTSMLPVLKAGDLISIEEISPSQVKVGDVIVFNVPSPIQDAYNYPPVVAHRVIKITEYQGTFGFRTKGDNTGDDPFTVRTQDLRGTVSQQYSGLGYPLLFFQSQQGMIFVIIALGLLAFFLYGSELGRGGSLIHRGIFAPIINEERRSNRVLTSKIEATEQKMNTTEQALEKFATAIAAYAQHLASHTSAIQGLAEASHELKRSAADQNRVLAHLMENMGQPGLKPLRLTPVVEMTIPEPEPPPPVAQKPKPEVWRVLHGTGAKPFPPGCARSRQPRPDEETLIKRTNPAQV